MIQIKKGISHLLLLTFVVSAFSSCNALKTTKCDRCPEFTKIEKVAVPTIICENE